MLQDDHRFLYRAIDLAKEACQLGNDPFGAVLVLNGVIVHEALDRSVELSDPTYHAESAVIAEYCRSHHLFSLEGYSLYASTEPCVMCSGAIHWARISRVVFSVSQAMLQEITGGRPKPGCSDILNAGHRTIEVVGPLLTEEGLAALVGYSETLSRIERHRKRFSTDYDSASPFDNP